MFTTDFETEIAALDAKIAEAKTYSHFCHN